MMENINIKTTLGFMPRPQKHEIIYITRGATASFNFDFSNKIYSFSNVEQMTYTFKQGRNLFWYKAIEYFRLSKDMEVIPEKTYYVVNPIDIETSYQCIATKIENPTGCPKEKGYFEMINDELEDIEECFWQLNSHFYFAKSGEIEYMNFILSAIETRQFKPTSPDDNVKFEIAVRLNTDDLSGMHGHDSVVIEPQHPVVVIDSLYGKR